EWLYLGILSAVAGCAILALASGLRTGRLWRMSTRDWLVIVAGAAIGLAGVAFLQRRSGQFRQLANFHARERIKVFLSGLEIFLAPDPDRRPVTLFVDYHLKMQFMYELATRRPWLFVQPGPAPPAPDGEMQAALRVIVRGLRGTERRMPTAE